MVCLGLAVIISFALITIAHPSHGCHPPMVLCGDRPGQSWLPAGQGCCNGPAGERRCSHTGYAGVSPACGPGARPVRTRGSTLHIRASPPPQPSPAEGGRPRRRPPAGGDWEALRWRVFGSCAPRPRIPHPPTPSPARGGGQNLALRCASFAGAPQRQQHTPSPRLGEGGRGVRARSASGRYPPKTLHLRGLGGGPSRAQRRRCKILGPGAVRRVSRPHAGRGPAYPGRSGGLPARPGP